MYVRVMPEYAGHAGAHQTLEVKVYNTIAVSDTAQPLRCVT